MQAQRPKRPRIRNPRKSCDSCHQRKKKCEVQDGQACRWVGFMSVTSVVQPCVNIWSKGMVLSTFTEVTRFNLLPTTSSRISMSSTCMKCWPKFESALLVVPLADDPLAE